jgi:hypothetical protein
MAKVLLFALLRRIRSTRQIEYNLRHSIDFMWLASGRSIDYSTLSKFRKKHQKQLKGIYRQVVQYAVDLGLAKLSELVIDGTRVLANASRRVTLTAFRVKRLLKNLEKEFDAAMQEMDDQEAIEDLADIGDKADQLPPELHDIHTRHKLLQDVLKQLEEMDRRRKKEGVDPEKNPAQLALADLDARIVPNKEGGYAPNYTPLAVTETQNGFIVMPEIPEDSVEHTYLVPMTDAIREDYGAEIEWVLCDGIYPTGENLDAMEKRGIRLVTPVKEDEETQENPAIREDLSQPVPEEKLGQLPMNKQTNRFGKDAFVYDSEADVYYCPAGRTLSREGSEKQYLRSGEVIVRDNYRGKCANSGCPLKSLCRTNPGAKGGRKVSRDTYEETRQRHRQRMSTPEAKEHYKKRQHFGETQFAVLKVKLDMRRFLLRGREGVGQEWLWSCMAFNVNKRITLQGALRSEFQAESQIVVN